MTKVRSLQQVDQAVRKLASDRRISIIDAISIYTAERAKHGIAVLWDENTRSMRLREQWVGKGAVTYLQDVQDLLSPIQEGGQ